MNSRPLKYLFVINPKSGNQKLYDWNALITSNIGNNNYEILISEYPGHSKSIIAQYHKATDLCVVAVGGDGTVNDLAHSLIKSHAILGIIPTGSGNGLARHLKIPMNPIKAIHQLISAKTQQMDIIQMNDHYSCNTCGIGFSAFVTKHFGTKGKRGFSTYFKLALSLYKTSQTFDISINDTIYEDVWSVEIANSSQMGNNAIVSPFASVSDGIMDILIMSRPKAWQIPGLIFMVFSKNILRSRLSRFLTAPNLNIILKDEVDYHVDGDYKGQSKYFEIRILPLVLKIKF